MLNIHNLTIATFAPADESRFGLKVVNVKPEHTEVTDGHCALRVTTPKRYSAEDFPQIDGLKPADNHQPFMLGKDDALQLKKLIGTRRLKAGKEFPVCEYAAIGEATDQNGHCEIGLFVNKDLDRKQVMKFEKQAGQFPNIDAVMPKEDRTPDFVGHFNPRLLGELLLKLAEIGDDRAACKLSFYRTSPNDPKGGYLCIFETQNTETGQTATGALMGMRV